MEIQCPLQSAAREVPDLPAVETPDRILSYSDLDALVSGTAHRLLETGLKPQDRVAILLDNDRRCLICMLAAIRAGLTVCMLSTRLPSGTAARLCAGVDARLLISDQTTNGIRTAVPDAFIRPVAPASASPVKRSTVFLDRAATVVFTSGSTGAARAALHTYGNHYFNAEGSNSNIVLEPGDRWLLSLPLYHVGGLAILFRCLLARAAVFVPDPRAPLQDSLARVTHVSMVSTQLRRFLQTASSPSLKAVLLGGSAIPNPLVVDAHERGLPIHTSYGSTEMASQVTTTPPGASLEVLGTSGRLLRHRELRIDRKGQILVRGRTRFVGYLDGAALQQPFDADGWYATRDLGRLDERGFLHVLGRMDNMFISGGENVIPEVIEAALCTVPSVRRALVVPVDDEEFGHRPVAFIDTAGAAVPEDTLRGAVEEVLPRFMIPIRFFAWPDEADAVGLKPDRDMMRRSAARLYAGG